MDRTRKPIFFTRLDCLRLLIWSGLIATRPTTRDNVIERIRNAIQSKYFYTTIKLIFYWWTHFTDRSYFNIPQYTTYSTNHPDNTAHAGSAILIISSVSHIELPKYEFDHIQATTIKVKLSTYELTVASAYCPPRHNLKKENFNNLFETQGNKFIVGGDFNSKHTLYGTRFTTTKRRELVSSTQDKRYQFLSTGTPTYWLTDLNKVPDLLDLFIINDISSESIEVVPNYDLSSDHSPIIATVSCFIIHKKPNRRLHNSKTNWIEHQSKLEDIKLQIKLKTAT